MNTKLLFPFGVILLVVVICFFVWRWNASELLSAPQATHVLVGKWDLIGGSGEAGGPITGSRSIEFRSDGTFVDVIADEQFDPLGKATFATTTTIGNWSVVEQYGDVKPALKETIQSGDTNYFSIYFDNEKNLWMTVLHDGPDITDEYRRVD